MTPAKFEEALEKLIKKEKQSADWNIEPCTNCIRTGANLAQSFYLPMLREAMAALERLAVIEMPDRAVKGDEFLEYTVNAKCSLANKALASLRQKLGEGEEK